MGSVNSEHVHVNLTGIVSSREVFKGGSDDVDNSPTGPGEDNLDGVDEGRNSYVYQLTMSSCPFTAAFCLSPVKSKPSPPKFTIISKEP